jgi:penicillin-binding protein 1A
MTDAIERPPRPRWRSLLLLGAGAVGAGIGLGLLVVLVLLPTLPSVQNIAEDQLKVPLRVYSAEGRLLGEFGDERRIPVTIGELPQPLIQAVLAAEDDSFYSHWGIDVAGIARAALFNMLTRSRGQGASTITMQVARNFFLSPERTYTRKLKEVLLAFKLEYVLSKDEILSLYFNKIFLGNRAYGFAAAAQVYYGKSLGELSLPEMAMLAGLPKAPSRNNPINNPENAIERRNYVLGRMAKLGYIDEATLKEASQAPVTASRHEFEYDVKAPYVAEMVRQYMYDTYAEKTYGGGFNVHTTIRAEHQQAANRALRQGVIEYDQRHGYRGPAARVKLPPDITKESLDEILKGYRAIGGLSPAIVLSVAEKAAATYTQDGYLAELDWPGMEWARRFRDRDYVGSAPKKAGDVVRAGDVIYLDTRKDGGWRLAQAPEISAAIVSLNPRDGAILALAGGFDFQDSKFNRVTQAERQPGSNIKPFIYSAALEKGYTAASRVSGAPIVIEDRNLEGQWKPQNYSGKFFGPTRLRTALTKSMNLVSVRLLREIGPAFAVDYLERFGFRRDKLPPNLSLALGNAALTPLEVVTGFGVFANGGYRVAPYFITRVEDANGNILEQANPTRICPTCPETEILYPRPENAAVKPAVTVSAAQPAPAVAAPAAATTGATPDAADAPPAPPPPRYAPAAITPENAYIMTTIMRDVVKRGTARAALVLDRKDLAGKTGTTNDFNDAWFSGYNSDIVATAWIGFDQPASLGRHESGARAALPIWIDYMRTALAETPETVLTRPENVVAVMINPETGDYLGPAQDETDPAGTPAPNTDDSVKPLDTEANIDPLLGETPLEEPSESAADAPPEKEYFIRGTEPAAPAEGSTNPVAKPKPSGSDLEGLF